MGAKFKSEHKMSVINYEIIMLLAENHNYIVNPQKSLELEIFLIIFQSRPFTLDIIKTIDFSLELI
jgi:hypothetical protein